MTAPIYTHDYLMVAPGRPPVPMDVVNRMWENTVPGENGCVLSARRPNKGRYVVIHWYVDGEHFQEYAHRIAQSYINEFIEDGLTVDHINGCHRSCIRPDHLRLLTRSANSTDGNNRRWTKHRAEKNKEA
jgi:hypothetical protein